VRAPSSCRRGSQRIPPVSCRASPLGPPVPVIKSNKTQRGPDQSKHSCYSSHVGGRIRVLTWSVPATTSAIPCRKRALVNPVGKRTASKSLRVGNANGNSWRLHISAFLGAKQCESAHPGTAAAPVEAPDENTSSPNCCCPELVLANYLSTIDHLAGAYQSVTKRCLTLYLSVGYYSSSKLTPQRTRLP
jgi:hypothetical protein